MWFLKLRPNYPKEETFKSCYIRNEICEAMLTKWFWLNNFLISPQPIYRLDYTLVNRLRTLS